MSDLQDELNEIGSTLNHWPAIVEAARRVANPDYEAAVEGLVGAFDIPPISAKIMAQYCIDSALGVTEDE